MKKLVLHCLLVLSVGLCLPCQAGLKVYYLRHAQSGENVSEEWSSIPTDKRPAYVGNAAAFSPLGEQQAADVPNKLAPYKFDFIAVSPLWRARHTILPYLMAENRKAEIWPELIEFGPEDGDLSLIGTQGLPSPTGDVLTGGSQIVLPEKERPYFTLREDGLTEPKLGHLGAQGAADLNFMLKRVIVRLRTKFGGTGRSVLLVGHSGAGWHLLDLLTGDRKALERDIENTGLWMAEEQPDGTFRIMIANGKPVGRP